MDARHKYNRSVIVDQYEARRCSSPKWEAEWLAIQSLLQGVREGRHVLDVPVGTGRFVDIYKRIKVARMVGVDTSSLMLERARVRGFDLRKADIRNLPFHECEFDTSICIRLAGWLPPKDLQKAIFELTRVSAIDVIFGIRTVESDTRVKHRAYWLHSYGVFEKIFKQVGFKQAERVGIGDNGYAIYRMIRV